MIIEVYGPRISRNMKQDPSQTIQSDGLITDDDNELSLTWNKFGVSYSLRDFLFLFFSFLSIITSTK